MKQRHRFVPHGGADLPKLPTSDYLSKVTMLAAVCCAHREKIRKVRNKPRKHASLKGLKKIEPEILKKWEVHKYSKADFKKATKLLNQTVAERPSRLIGEINLHEYVVPITSLEKNSKFNGARILHLSDIHLQFGNLRSLRQLEDLARNIKNLNIDLIAITGDLADQEPRDISPEAVLALTALKNQVPNTFFVCGNHDYDAGISEVIAQVKSAGIKVLINDAIFLGEGEDRLQVIGLDDIYHQIKLDAEFFRHGSLTSSRFIKGVPTIVLTHSIDSLCDADLPMANLVLSGHTHGLLFKGLPGRKEWLKYNPGQCLLYDHNNQHSGWKAFSPTTLSYVSNGFTDHHRRGVRKGHPFRQASEITIIEIRSYNELLDAQ